MNRDQLRAVIAASVGNPTNGAVAESIDTIADAVDLALHPVAPVEQRVVSAPETR